MNVSTTDIEQGKRNLDALGYTIHEGFLSSAECTALLERLDEQATLEREAGVATLSEHGNPANARIGGVDGEALPAWQGISFLPNKGRVFIDLMKHPITLAYCRHAFRDLPFNLVTQTGTIVRKGARQQVVHVDQQALPFETPVPVMLNVMLCLTDFEPEMGATRIVPGTQKSRPPRLAVDAATGLAVNTEQIEIELVPATAKAGSAIIWESRVWHCQGASTSDRVRYGIVNVYGLHFMKPQDDYPALLHDDVYASLSDEERELLGFKVAYEYAGRIAPRRPDDMRSNTNCRFPYVPELRRGGTKTAVPLTDMGVSRADVMAELL